jgi:hypothetical protein
VFGNVPRGTVLESIELKPSASIVAAFLVVGCSGAPIEEGWFFPTWGAEGDIPGGQVVGALVEDNRCLVETNDQRTLVVWEDGMGFENGALLDASGYPIAMIGEVIHGGGAITAGVTSRSSPAS